MNITWVEKNELMAIATQNMVATDVLVDIGCGIIPQSYVRPNIQICCEPYLEYISYLKEKISSIESPDRYYVILNMDWSDVIRHFPEKSVDTVILVDVIEHLNKKEGEKLLLATEKIVRKQIIIFTPLGFMPQHHADGKDAWGLNGGDWQEHKSGWTPEDFKGNDWQFYASREFHTEDNMLNLLEKPFGAFWAIKTCHDSKYSHYVERETMLQNFEIKLKQQQIVLQQKEDEINKLRFTRFERRMRRIFLKYCLPLMQKINK